MEILSTSSEDSPSPEKASSPALPVSAVPLPTDSASPIVDARRSRLEEQRRRSRIYIAATLSAGLLIAAGYVSTRIYSAPAMAKASPAAAPRSAAEPHAASTEAVVPASPPVPQVAEPQVEKKEPEAPAPTQKQVATVAKPLPPQTPPTVVPSSESGSRSADSPRAGKYLQIGALSSPTVAKYVSELRRDQWEPLVVDGPRSGIDRVLVGPFSDRAALEAAEARLQALGIDYFVRSYSPANQ